MRILVLFALTLLGCGLKPGPLTCGAGTMEVDGQCVVAPSDPVDAGGTDAGTVDAGTPDAGTVDGGSTLLRDGDALLVSNDVTVAAGLAHCLTASVLHADGTREEAVGAFVIEVINPSIAMRSEPRDCSTIGLVGLAPGQTLVKVSLTSGSVTVRAQFGVTVPTHVLRIAGLGTMERQQIVGEPRQLQLLGLELWNEAGTQQIFGGNYGQLVTRWLNVETSSRLEMRELRWPKVLVVGQSAGAATLTATYQVPGKPLLRSVATPFTLTDLSTLTFYALAGVALVDEVGFAVPVASSGACATPVLLGWFKNGSLQLVGHLSDATWTATGAGVQLHTSPNPQVCAGTPGEEGVITGCSHGSCLTQRVMITDPTVTSLTARVLSSATQSLNSDQRLCVPVRLDRAHQSGAIDDVTLRPGVEWRLTAHSGSPPTASNQVTSVSFLRALTTNGPIYSATGDPCFTVSQPQDTFTSSYTVLIDAQYDRKQATGTFSYAR